MVLDAVVDAIEFTTSVEAASPRRAEAHWCSRSSWRCVRSGAEVQACGQGPGRAAGPRAEAPAPGADPARSAPATLASPRRRADRILVDPRDPSNRALLAVELDAAADDDGSALATRVRGVRGLHAEAQAMGVAMRRQALPASGRGSSVADVIGRSRHPFVSQVVEAGGCGPCPPAARRPLHRLCGCSPPRTRSWHRQPLRPPGRRTPTPASPPAGGKDRPAHPRRLWPPSANRQLRQRLRRAGRPRAPSRWTARPVRRIGDRHRASGSTSSC